MLAADDIVLSIGGEVHTLRPSLRAGIRLERIGLAKLAEGLATGSISILTAILVECGAPDDVFHAVTLGDALSEATLAATTLLAELYGLDEPTDTELVQAEGHGVTHAEAFRRLYQAGTGTMGWSPEQTLAASPAEITEAIEGRHSFVGDLLRAVFGSPKNDDGDEPPPSPANQNQTPEEFLARADAQRDGSGFATLSGLERAA